MNIEVQYLNLLQEVLEQGKNSEDRTGTGTLSVFGRTLVHDMRLGFPLLTTKAMALKSVFEELMWFMKGKTDLKYLLEHSCNIWVGDFYKRYLTKVTANPSKYLEYILDINEPYSKDEFVFNILNDDEFNEKWGNAGPIYGYHWIRQLPDVIEQIKNNPSSRRLVVDSWDYNLLPKMLLPPCHYSYQFYVNSDKLDILVNLRSNDLPLGCPYNIASYALLLLIVSSMTNKTPGKLILNIGDAHIYLNQVQGVIEQLNRIPKKLPSLTLNKDLSNSSYEEVVNNLYISDFTLTGYEPESKIHYPLSN